MDEIKFWNIIIQTNGGFLENPGSFLNELSNHLKILSPKEILDFYLFVKKCRNDAELGKLWAAGMLMNRGHGTDSGFDYFRNWLTACGESIFKQALNDPDSLANLPLNVNNVGSIAELEGLFSVISDAYEERTGRDFFEAINKHQSTVLNEVSEPEEFDWMAYDNEQYLKIHLPRLWEKYGAFLQKLSESTQNQGKSKIHVQGLGILSVGDEVSHPKFGLGKVESVKDNGGVKFASIEFQDHGKEWLAVDQAGLSLIGSA